MKGILFPYPDDDSPEARKYSNHPYGLGDGSRKGRIDRDYDRDKTWTEDDIKETGLTDREPL